jgi:hypothetical protein
MAGVRFVVLFGTLFLSSMAALAGDAGPLIEVKVLSSGVVVATARLPSDSTFSVTAERMWRAKPENVPNSRPVTTAVGHATLVASQGGKEILTLNGEQLEVTGLPQ